MPHLLALVRPLTTGAGLEPLPALGHAAVLLAYFVIPFTVATARGSRPHVRLSAFGYVGRLSRHGLAC